MSKQYTKSAATSVSTAAPECARKNDVTRQPSPIAQLFSWSDKKKEYALSVALAILGVAGSMIPYVAAGNIIANILQGSRDWNGFVQWIVWAAAGYVVYLIGHFSSTAVSHAATFATVSRIRRMLAQKLTRVPMGYVLDTPSGTLKSLMVEKVDSIETTMAHAVPELSSNLLVSAAVIIYIFVLDWRLALLTFVPIALGMVCMMGMMLDYDKWFSNTVRTGKIMNNTSVEFISGMEVIKAFGQSASSYKKFSQAVHDSAHAFIDWMAHCQIWSDVALSVAPATLLLVLPLGCLFVLDGSLAPETFVLAAVLSLGIFPPLYAAMSFSDALAEIGITVGEIQKVLSAPEQQRARSDLGAAVSTADLLAKPMSLRDVSFSYDGSREVLHNINVDIAPQSVTALVGPSGSGKSTLARLIAGFWDPTQGSVSIAGVPIQNMTADQLAALIAYVDQKTYLFDDTIMNNIRMGRPAATDDEVMACAKASGCHEFICSLSEGYQTVVGSSGGHLSGGERQRIAIARAMLKDAPIVLLDEATAYTDPESEAEVQAAVAKLVANKTLVVIAHRLSTIKDADRIVVVNDGRIEAAGTHEQLMHTCALYADMYRAHIGAKNMTDTSDVDEVTATDASVSLDAPGADAPDTPGAAPATDTPAINAPAVDSSKEA